MTSLSLTLERFSVLNLPKLKKEIHRFFLENELPESLKNNPYKVLEEGPIHTLAPLQSLPNFSKTDGRREFEVRFKFQSGYSKESFRIKFMAYEYEVTPVLLLEFSDIGRRDGFYSKA